MGTIDIFVAWQLWFSGMLEPHFLLWGVPLFWWGRIGKLVEFASAGTIIADILGPERIRVYGSSLHQRFTLEMAKQVLRNYFSFGNIIIRYFATSDSSEEDQLLDQFLATKYGVISAILGSVLTFWLLYSYGTIGWFLENISQSFQSEFLLVALVKLGFGGFVGLLIWGCAMYIVLPIFLFAAILFFVGFASAFDALVIEPLAWILERPLVDRYIKVLSLLLLIIGFHFDILAS